MADKTVAFRPFPGQSFSITGSECDAGIVGELERTGGFYQRDLAELLQRRLEPDAVVLDIGAHIGVVTALLAGLCPKGQVYSFEPATENHAHLTINVAANGFDNVTVERAAIFDTDGEIRLEFDATYPGGSHVGDGGATVPSLRLDTWMRATGLDRLDLVKLDVEGVELAVLEGAAETLRRFRPILVVECNPVALPRFGRAGYALMLRRLRALYPLVGVIGSGGRVTPIVSVEHLRLVLAERGVVDLVGLPGSTRPDRARQWARGAADLAQRFARDRRHPPAHNFIIDPGRIVLRPAVARLEGPPGATVDLDVEIRNGSRSRLPVELPHPVNVSYRWLDSAGRRTGSEGGRTGFREPLAPGGSARVSVPVTLPTSGGRHTLELTLVQEFFAWLDDVDPACAARLPVVVTGEG